LGHGRGGGAGQDARPPNAAGRQAQPAAAQRQESLRSEFPFFIAGLVQLILLAPCLDRGIELAIRGAVFDWLSRCVGAPIRGHLGGLELRFRTNFTLSDVPVAVAVAVTVSSSVPGLRPTSRSGRPPRDTSASAAGAARAVASCSLPPSSSCLDPDACRPSPSVLRFPLCTPGVWLDFGVQIHFPFYSYLRACSYHCQFVVRLPQFPRPRLLNYACPFLAFIYSSYHANWSWKWVKLLFPRHFVILPFVNKLEFSLVNQT
jgi:hypothetical protein